MRLQLLTTLAAAVALTACESTTEQKSGMYDWPSSASVEGPVPGSVEHFKQTVQDRVHFDFNKSNIRAEDKAVAEKQAGYLKEYPSVAAVIEGHCDVRGTTEYNMALGERRGNALKKELVKNGIDAKRLEVVSYGKEHPEATGNTEADHAKNRRAVVVIR
jgi:peptidoglycan-associated lipoprotein